MRAPAILLWGVFPLAATFATAAVPSDAVRVSLPEGDLAYPRYLEEEESDDREMWWWSDECLPVRVENGSESVCEPGRLLTLTVVDHEGRPLPDATVVWGEEDLVRELPDRLLPSGRTGQEGKIALRVDDSTLVRVRAEAGATFWQSIPDTGVVRTREARPVTVELEGSDGEEVDNGWVEILPRGGALPIREIAPGGTSEIGPIPMLPSLDMVTWSASHAPVIERIDRESDAHRSVMPVGGGVYGTISSPESEPLEGAGLRIRFELGGLGWAVERQASLHADGSFEVGGLPHSPVEWLATAPEHTLLVGSATVGDRTSLGDIRLFPARTLELSVESDTGEPVPDATVVLETGVVARTGPEGSALLEKIPRSSVKVKVTAPGYLTHETLIEAGISEATLTLDRGAGIRANPLSVSTGEVPPSVTIQIRNEGRTSRRVVELDDVLELSGLSPGRTALTISAAGHVPYETGPLTLQEGELRDLGTLMLERGVSLRGRVVREEGEGVEGATIRVLDQFEKGPMLAWAMRAWTEESSGPDGEFMVGGLEPGPQLIVIEAPGHLPLVLPGVRLEADGAGAHDLGQLALPLTREVKVKCTPADACGAEASILLAGPAFPFIDVRESLREGIAEFRVAPVGKWMLRLSKGPSLIHEEAVTIREGDEIETIEIELPAVRVEGRVWTGNDPAQGGRVRLTRETGSSLLPIQMERRSERGSSYGSSWMGTTAESLTATVDDDGRFTLENVQPGDYEAYYGEDGGSTAPVRVTIPDVERYDLPLRFEGASVAGIVIDTAGEPLSASIGAIDGSGRYHAGKAGSDGRFEILGLAEGDVAVRATREGASAERVVDTGSRRARELELRLETEKESAELAVSVVKEDGTPVSAARVLLTQGGFLRSGTTGPDGMTRFRVSSGGFLAAYSRGEGWGFATSAGEPTRIVLPREPATLEVASAERICSLRIVHESGFPLHDALPWVSVSPLLTPGGSLFLHGLPPGSYTMYCGGAAESVRLGRREVERVEF